ncbi:MAG: prepilin-type N-terminal cleavage/methylation domain-containing protein [Candidatus Electrothrix sp. AR5]|nr:prepilin-type N-terminal cleavage/methylation domain-containing protein [Candidatus Electrothrix sp. AR5]
MIKNKKISNSKGFTFAELMVVIAVIGVLSAVGIPSFMRGMPERRLKNATRNLYADLQKARLLAVKENRDITVRFFDSVGSVERGYFFDEDGDTEPIRDFTDSDVLYGCKAAIDAGVKNTWRPSSPADPDDTIPDTGWTKNSIIFTNPYTGLTSNIITFNNLGVANPEDIYLQSQNDATVCYAVTVSSLGVVKIFKYSDSVWK